MIYFYIRLCHIFLFYTSKEWLDFSNKMREDGARLPGQFSLSCYNHFIRKNHHSLKSIKKKYMQEI